LATCQAASAATLPFCLGGCVQVGCRGSGPTLAATERGTASQLLDGEGCCFGEGWLDYRFGFAPNTVGVESLYASKISLII
jgi:hypothetical protein